MRVVVGDLHRRSRQCRDAGAGFEQVALAARANWLTNANGLRRHHQFCAHDDTLRVIVDKW
jgi:hypothetical protein